MIYRRRKTGFLFPSLSKRSEILLSAFLSSLPIRTKLTNEISQTFLLVFSTQIIHLKFTVQGKQRLAPQ